MSVQPPGILGIAVYALGYGPEERVSEHRQFVWQGGVHDTVGVLYERYDVPQFTVSYVMPVGQCLERLKIPEMLVPVHSSQEPVVGPTHERAVPCPELPQCLDIELELVLCRYLAGHILMESVQAVDKQDLVSVQFERMDIQCSLSVLKL